MGADLIVVLPPSGDSHLGVHAIPKPLQRQKLIAELTIERFVGACHGLPGSMNAVSIPASRSHRKIAAATNSGPLAAGGVPEPVVLTEPEATNRCGLSILVAEDFADNRVLIEAYLRGSPHTLTFADDGRHTLELFIAGRFDLVLMDIQMPVMDGLEATRAIRAFEGERVRPATPVIAVTANARPEDMQTSRAAGCTDHLSKPLSKRALLRAIQRVESQASVDIASREDAVDIEVPEGLEHLIPPYLEARRRDVEEGGVLLARGDFAGVAAIGHKMKGTGSSYGFRLMTELGASLEHSARAGDGDRSAQHLQTLHAYLARVHRSSDR